MHSKSLIVLVVTYLASLSLGCVLLFSDGSSVERMIAAEAPYAQSQSERDKIVRVASSTRLGIESYPEIIYVTAVKQSVKGALFIALLYIAATVIFLYYSDLKGTFSTYGSAFIIPLWILSIANIVNPLLKIFLCRIAGSLSFAMFLRPFNWNDVWQVLLLKTDLFFLAYLVAAGIGCASIAGVHKGEGVALAAIVWLVVYFTSMILGIEPIITL
jgi:hypothetical protein